MDDCWDYLGPFFLSNSGNYYGRYAKKSAHRLSYETFKGKIPQGLTIDHLCHNPICINPDHLEAVTLIENMRRGNCISSVNARKTLCKRGHEFVHVGGRRQCYQCMRDMKKKQYWERKAKAALEGVGYGKDM